MSNTMTFRLNDNGKMELVAKDILKDIKRISPISTMHNEIVIKKSFTSKFKNVSYSIAPFSILLATTGVGGSGVFWSAFMNYIFPWMLDIAKVFCAIKIAQAFYQEKRGGRDEGTGFGALATYGKWYLVFWLIPWGVELIDQIGGKMLNDLRMGGA